MNGKITMAKEDVTKQFFIHATPNERIFKRLVRSGKSLKRQGKWAHSLYSNSNRLEMVAS
jgi:hypothetical protein